MWLKKNTNFRGLPVTDAYFKIKEVTITDYIVPAVEAVEAVAEVQAVEWVAEVLAVEEVWTPWEEWYIAPVEYVAPVEAVAYVAPVEAVTAVDAYKAYRSKYLVETYSDITKANPLEQVWYTFDNLTIDELTIADWYAKLKSIEEFSWAVDA